MSRPRDFFIRILLPLLIGIFVLAACSSASDPSQGLNPPDALQPIPLPELKPAELEDGQLMVVATTSIIGDFVDHIGGEAINLTVLMESGQDPHGYVPSVGDLANVAGADVIFVNGWALEEGLLENLESVVGGSSLVPVSAGIEPLRLNDLNGKPQNNSSVDPHTWLDPNNALQWANNIQQVLGELDPGNAQLFENNADSFRESLQELIDYYDLRVASIPEGDRKLVTNHDALGYFAKAYDFEIVGTVIPGGSTLSEPAAGNLAGLVEEMERQGICAIFVEVTANEALPLSVAKDVTGCESVRLVPLYTGALGPAGSGTEDYLMMMRANIDAIVEGLK